MIMVEPVATVVRPVGVLPLFNSGSLGVQYMDDKGQAVSHSNNGNQHCNLLISLGTIEH